METKLKGVRCCFAHQPASWLEFIMILSPLNTELTKVHYFERRLRSQQHEIADNRINIEIKRNIFGRKQLTFNVNRIPVQQRKKPPRSKSVVIITFGVVFLLFTSISFIAAIYFNQHRIDEPVRNRSSVHRVVVFDHGALNVENILSTLKNQPKVEVEEREQAVFKCNCSEEEVCLREGTRGTLKCLAVKDRRDPSGCGGLCAVNTQHCRMLDRETGVRECAENKSALRCPLGYFNCADRLCIHTSRACDGSDDCGGLQDEIDCECNLETHFHCGNDTSCLAKSKLCDGKLDCWDASDEADCPHAVLCPPGDYHCTDGQQCFHAEQFCDGRTDCADGSDEICIFP